MMLWHLPSGSPSRGTCTPAHALAPAAGRVIIEIHQRCRLLHAYAILFVEQ